MNSIKVLIFAAMISATTLTPVFAMRNDQCKDLLGEWQALYDQCKIEASIYQNGGPYPGPIYTQLRFSGVMCDGGGEAIQFKTECYGNNVAMYNQNILLQGTINNRTLSLTDHKGNEFVLHKISDQ